MGKTRITIDVKANAREESLEKIEEGWYSVKVKAPRRGGKANADVIRLLHKHFGGRAKIVHGLTSSRKIVEIED